jgi:type VI secretion system secreted protein Hcp
MAFDAFVQIDGIPGESTDAKHQDWIEILSFSHGVSQPVSVASATKGRTAERVNIEDFSIVKVLDKSSPLLALACCDGRHIGKVVIELCEATRQKHPYMKYTLENVVISSVRPGGSSQGSDAKPLEEVTFNFGKVRWEYMELNSDGTPGGTTPTGWNLETNEEM